MPRRWESSADGIIIRLKQRALFQRYRSKADIHPHPTDVRFTPESGHCLSVSGCPLVPITNIGNDFMQGRIIASPSLQPWDREDAASRTVPSPEYRSLS